MPERFYLDEDVPYALTLVLTKAKHDAVHVRDRGTKHRSDSYHFYTATCENRIMIIYNRNDFFLLHELAIRWGVGPLPAPSATPPASVHPGILHFPQGLSPQQMSQAISVFLASVYPIRDLFYSYTDQTGWVRQDFPA